MKVERFLLSCLACGVAAMLVRLLSSAAIVLTFAISAALFA
jgi:hypothetical protein